MTKSIIYWLLGIALTLGAPILETGPSFVTFLSLQSAALLVLAGFALLSRDTWRARTMILGIVFLIYVSVTSIATVLLYQYPPQFSAWVLCVFLVWVLVFVHLSLTSSVLRSELLSGVLVGGWINIGVIFINLSGENFLAYWSAMINVERAGPWAHYFSADTAVYSIHGAIGLFSFSRTASGYFFAILYLLTILKSKENSRMFLFASTMYAAAIGLTGSKLGFVLFTLFFAILAFRFFQRRPATAIVFGPVFVAIGACVLFYMVSPEFLGRIFGISDDGYGAFLEGRLERQAYILDLDPWEYVFGVGAGNLSFRTGADALGYRLYGLHNAVLQYVANIGIVGTILYTVFVASLVKFWGGWRLVFLISALVSSVGDDFLFPSTQGSAIPVILILAILWTSKKEELAQAGPLPKQRMSSAAARE